MPNLTIDDILRLRPGTGPRDTTWIDGSFEAVVRNTERKTSQRGPYTKCTLVDPHNERIFIDCMGDGDLARYEGRLVRFSGKGMKRTAYKDTPQVGISDKATIEELGRAADTRGDSRDTRDTRSDSEGSPSTAPDGVPAYQIEGQAVGNALTNAVACVLAKTPLMPGTSDFAREVYIVASDLLRVAQELRAGRMMKSAKDREAKAKAPPKTEPPKTPPPPPKPQDIDEEDVPFSVEAHDDLVKNMLQVRLFKAAA